MNKQIEFDNWKSFREYEQDGYWNFSENNGDINISLAGGKFVCVQFEKIHTMLTVILFTKSLINLMLQEKKHG